MENNNNINNDNVEIKQKKRFVDYYQDEEFKKRHKEYLKTKVECECGAIVMRANLTRHKYTPKHQKYMNFNVDNLMNDYLEVMSENKLRHLQNKIESIINANK